MEENVEQPNRVPIRAGRLRNNKYSGEFGKPPTPTPDTPRSRSEFDLYIRSISLGTVALFLMNVLLFLLCIVCILAIARGW